LTSLAPNAGSARVLRRTIPRMPLAEGSEFAGYTVVRLLGSGGMDEVYLARHPRLPRNDAVEVLPLGISSDPEYPERFVRQADLAAGLWHPNIVGVTQRESRASPPRQLTSVPKTACS
jgi:serine/threonine protein kinase